MLEFLLGSLESVRCEASGSGEDGAASGLNVVGDIVPDWSVGGCDLGEDREFCQESEVGVGGILGTKGGTWRDGRGENALHL